LLFELVIANPIVTGDNDPTVSSRFAQPRNVLGPLRKQLVMNSDLDTGGAQRVGHFLSAQ